MCIEAQGALIGCVYRSPGSSGTNNDHLNKLISEAILYKHSHFFLLGDFNYANIDWQNWCTASDNIDSPDSKFKDGIKDDVLFQHVTSPQGSERLGNKSNKLDLV